MDAARTQRIKMLQQFLAEDPNDHFSRYALALEMMPEDAGAAVLMLEDLLRQDPAFLAAYYQLGKALEMKGRIKDALQIYHFGREVARSQGNLKTENELKSAADMLENEA